MGRDTSNQPFGNLTHCAVTIPNRKEKYNYL